MENQDGFGLCPYATAQRLLGGKWAVLVLHHLSGGTLRFSQLKRRMPALTQATLTKQLRELEKNGLVCRKVYAEVPPKVEYSLTPIGLEFGQVLDSLEHWGKSYIEYLQKMEGGSVKAAEIR